jgi:uncharacterized membrane protein YhfC
MAAFVTDIWPMAVLTIVLSAALWGGMIWLLSGRTTKYLWLILPGLPLSAVVNILVKGPVAVAVAGVAGVSPQLTVATPLWFLLFALLLAPVTEEAIKAAPLLAPKLRRFVSGRSGALWTGMALGVGFGIGEAAFLAYGISLSPAYAGLPWYAFTGFLQERFIVCFLHGVMTAVVVTGLLWGARGLVLGYLAAVGLHALLNSSALLYQMGAIGIVTTQIAFYLALIAFVGLFLWMRDAASAGEG